MTVVTGQILPAKTHSYACTKYYKAGPVKDQQGKIQYWLVLDPWGTMYQATDTEFKAIFSHASND
jgi:hypothetical protein